MVLGKPRLDLLFSASTCISLCLREIKQLQSSPALCGPMDCNPPDSSISKNPEVGRQALLQGNLSDPGIKPTFPALEGVFLTTSTTWEAHLSIYVSLKMLLGGLNDLISEQQVPHTRPSPLPTSLAASSLTGISNYLKSSLLQGPETIWHLLTSLQPLDNE